MRLPNEKKLNHLMQQLPEGVVAPSAWLTAQGISPQLVQRYVQRGWLKKLARGCYAFPGQQPGWEGVLLGLSRLGEKTLHVGGKSALNRTGDMHYLSLGEEAAVDVWSDRRAPYWIEQLRLHPSLNFHAMKLFRGSAKQAGFTTLKTGMRDWQLRMSAPERAVMEILSEIDETEASFVFAAELFEGLALLRPKVIEELLQGCTRVKVKRLFLFLATHYRHPWVKQINMYAVDTGSGKRQIVKGGRLDRGFMITVPESFVG